MSDTGYKFSSAQAGDHDELHELVQGKGTYTSDISVPGQLHACFVRSPWAHARIRSIDVAQAKGTVGVHAVVTGADALLSPAAKKNFQEAYPDDALTRLWQRPLEPSWFAELRTQYAEKFKAA